jgi:hypothetical protein
MPRVFIARGATGNWQLPNQVGSQPNGRTYKGREAYAGTLGRDGDQQFRRSARISRIGQRQIIR